MADTENGRLHEMRIHQLEISYLKYQWKRASRKGSKKQKHGK